MQLENCAMRATRSSEPTGELSGKEYLENKKIKSETKKDLEASLDAEVNERGLAGGKLHQHFPGPSITSFSNAHARKRIDMVNQENQREDRQLPSAGKKTRITNPRRREKQRLNAQLLKRRKSRSQYDKEESSEICRKTMGWRRTGINDATFIRT